MEKKDGTFQGTRVPFTKNETRHKDAPAADIPEINLAIDFCLPVRAFHCTCIALPGIASADSSIYQGEYFSNVPSSRYKSVHLEKVEGYCDKFKYPNDLVIIVKTGANEVYDKVPTQLLTSLSCYRDILFFSDLEQQFGGYHIHDAIENVPLTIQRGNAEFNYYHKLRWYKNHGKDISRLRETDGTAAWELDKYKFLHMLEDAWRLRPGRKWYVFIEADTYLVQANLFHWLRRLDPTKLVYFGSHAYHKAPFAHGGSGFLLSGAAMAKYVRGDRGIIDMYDEMMKQEPFGDYVLSQALVAKGVNLTNAAPMLSAEKPTTLPFGPGPAGKDSHWCRPIVTLHHITPQEASSLWQLELQRKDPTVSTNHHSVAHTRTRQTKHTLQAPLLYQELFKSMIRADIAATRDDWDNLSDHSFVRPPGEHGDRQKPLDGLSRIQQEAHLSFEKCGRACEEDPRCFQYMYSNRTCGFSWFFRLGESRRPEEGISFQSGWDLDKIAKYQAEYACSVASTRWIDWPSGDKKT